MVSAAKPIGTERTVPFRADEELNTELQLDDDEKLVTPHLSRSGLRNSATLPGNPFVELNFESIWSHLEATLLTVKLDVLAPHLWLVATPSSASISPLHRQRILGRDIILTDTADLHLIWYHSNIYIKPLPRYLLSSAFWTYLVSARHPKTKNSSTLHAALLGFMRTYYHLIRSETDFNLALTHGLLPETTDFEAYARFIARFRDIPDADASPRFHFGELRLTRLNLWSAVFLRQLNYFNPARQYETYFSRFFQPLLFAFGMFSVLLSAMQVALAAREQNESSEGGWAKFVAVAEGPSIGTMLIVLVSAAWLLLVLCFKILNELVFALVSLVRKRFKNRRDVV